MIGPSARSATGDLQPEERSLRRDVSMPDLPLAHTSYRPVVAALGESEERFRVLVESVRRYAIFMLDPKGIILTWNRGIHELLGYNRVDVVGQSGAMVFNPADRTAGLFKRELSQARRSGETVLEHCNTRKDGSQIAVQDTTTSLFNAGGVLLGFAKVTRRLEGPTDAAAEATALELAKALAAVQVEIDHRRRLEVQLLTAVEDERQRIGRDLHDDLSQHLAAIAIMLGTIAKDVQSRHPTGAAKIRNIANSVNDAVALARNLSRGLHPVTLTNQGLPAALAELAERVPQDVQFKWPQSARLDLDESVALHVYRIAEEAVGNAIRHSGAKSITISLQARPNRQVILVISDNGKGFPQSLGHEGMGLQNMRYRARAAGGTVEITAKPGKGTRVECMVPLRPLRRGKKKPKTRSTRSSQT
jgi:PAS domain S-box-containing protein